MSDIATPGPVDPHSGQPDHHAEVASLKSWFRVNAISLLMIAVVITLVFVFLDPVDTLKVVLGLGLVIFIHELGHFLAAKACDVHVRTFSIGFGPAVPFCSYKWGETTYMIGIIPLGGYVAMVGEGDTAGEEEGEEDPRSFKHKSVGQRMIIISAGVIMNVILGLACFIAAYLHGVPEKPAIIGTVESGSAAWRAGLHTDSDIKQIDRRVNPVFDDIRPIVMSTVKDEAVKLVVDYRGKQQTLDVEPLRDEGVPYPQLGVAPEKKLTLMSSKRPTFRPVTVGSPAAKVQPELQQGDRIIGMTDPDDPTKVTALPADPSDATGAQASFAEYARRMNLLAGVPITFNISRGNPATGVTLTSVTVPPAYRSDLGVRMQMGKIVAIRRESPAEKAGVQARPFEGDSPAGDTIAAVGVVQPGGKKIWYANGTLPEMKSSDEQRPLDPIRLPRQLDQWAYTGTPLAERKPEEQKVELIVLRNVEHTEKRIPVSMDYDTSYRFDREMVMNPNSPLPLPGLGLAYWVNAQVDAVEPLAPKVRAEGKTEGEKSAAAQAGLQPRDLIEAVKFIAEDASGKTKEGEWNEIKGHQWAAIDSALQGGAPGKIQLKVKRGDKSEELTLTAQEDPTWPLDERGFLFQEDTRPVVASDVADAIGLGVKRTLRAITMIYLNLYSMRPIYGRVSAKTMSGPLTIATVSYRIAGEDFWQFLLFLGMISVNLAVVNFLPIPVLDGGHMVFLIVEKILGRPVPERVFAISMYIGLACILTLMLFVITLDVRRLFFGWF